MKRLHWCLLLVFGVLLGCKKDSIPTDSYFNFNGELKDASTGAPLSGVRLSAYSSIGDLNDAWNGTLQVQINAEKVTGPLGDFDFSFSSAQGQDYLGIANLPNGYQHYANVNGSVWNLYFEPYEYFTYSFSRFQLTNGGNYTINLFPVAAYSLVLPPLTQAQKKDTLVLEIPTITGIVKESYYLGYPLNLISIQSVRHLQGSNRAKGTFQLRRDTLIKSGAFNAFCAPNDTTKVMLDF